jgi:penicillin V acylase-like amidase (Ntn superfamily)
MKACSDVARPVLSGMISRWCRAERGFFMNNFRWALLFTLFLFMVTITTPVQACTTFIVGDSGRQLFGRNYDWHFSDGYIMVNKKGVRKKAYLSAEEPEGQPAAWTSRFGSITFNQFGREFPQGGMNEAGLVIESMSLMSTKFPDADGRPYVRSANLWRQYILDTCASVKDVIASDSRIRISYDAAKGIGTHFLVLDNEGDAAVIEFLNGVMVAYTGDALPMRVLSNRTYEASLPFWANNKRTPFFIRFSVSLLTKKPPLS